MELFLVFFSQPFCIINLIFIILRVKSASSFIISVSELHTVTLCEEPDVASPV